MDDIKKALDREYLETLGGVRVAIANSEMADWQLKKLNELHKERIDELNVLNKVEELKQNRKDRITKTVMEVLGIFVPVVASSYWMAKGLEFEEKGIFTSKASKWVSEHFRTFKK